MNHLSSFEEEKLLISLQKYFNDYRIVIKNKIKKDMVAGYHIMINGVSIDLTLKRKIDDLFNHVIN